MGSGKSHACVSYGTCKACFTVRSRQKPLGLIKAVVIMMWLASDCPANPSRQRWLGKVLHNVTVMGLIRV